MAIGDDFLQMLRCPLDKTPLVRADAELIERLNADIASGRLTTHAGQTVQRKMTEGLINEARTLLYPVFDGIPAMLVDDAIRLDEGPVG